jgi:hypothetical protein
MAFGPTTWQKPPEPSGTPLPPPPITLVEQDVRPLRTPSVTLNGPTPTATPSPSTISTYFLAGQTLPAPTPVPTPKPTPIPDTVANARAWVRSRLASSQFACVDALWWSESRWNPRAVNATTGAYGIPQSYPAEKMAAEGRNWRTSPRTQVVWGLSYIALRYGTACQAWNFRLANGWY